MKNRWAKTVLRYFQLSGYNTRTWQTDRQTAEDIKIHGVGKFCDFRL